MIADALRLEIERFDRRLQTHPLMAMTEAGEVGLPLVKDYLTNLRHMLFNGPMHIRAAADRARALGDMPLCRHFEAKLPEEVGHHEWAERDISSVDVAGAAEASPEMSPLVRELVDYVFESIEADPARYLAYALFAEYFTVLIGPRWLAALETKCGIPRSSMTALANHVELDRDHVDEAMDQIDDLVGDPRKLPAMREVVQRSSRLLDEFYAELARKYAPARGVRHVSAA